MKDYLKNILTRLIRANSETEMEAILEDAETVIANGNLTDKEAINFTTQIMNMKTQLGMVKRTKHYDLAVIQNVISNVKCDSQNATIYINNFFGLFSEDNTYTLVKNLSSISPIYDFHDICILNECCDLEQNAGKIVKIAEARTYVVPTFKIYCLNWYNVNDVQKTVNAVNLYLYENPDFIPSIFEQIENRQKTKR